MMAADNNPTLTQPLASTLAWTSRAGVLLDPQSVFGPNLGRFDQAMTGTPAGLIHQQQLGPSQLNEGKTVTP